MDRLQAMQVFCRIVDAGSLSGAARQLGELPSTISRTLNLLEQQLSARLLHRSTRSIALTEAGHHYYEQAHDLLLRMQLLEETISQQAIQPHGKLRITAPYGLFNWVISPNLGKFYQAYPQIELQIDLTNKEVDLVEQGFDLALRAGHLKQSNLIARPLWDFQYLCCASTKYIKRYGLPSTPTELSKHACLIYRHDARPQNWTFYRNGREQEVAVNGWLSINETGVLLTQCLEGLGIARLGSWIASQAIASGKLVRLFESYTLHPTKKRPTIYALYPKRELLPPKVRVFLTFLENLPTITGLDKK